MCHRCVLMFTRRCVYFIFTLTKCYIEQN